MVPVDVATNREPGQEIRLAPETAREHWYEGVARKATGVRLVDLANSLIQHTAPGALRIVPRTCVYTTL